MKNSLLQTPDQLTKYYWAKVPGYTKLTFVAAMLLGLAAHLFMFANKLPNHDDLHHLFNTDYGTMSGRWLLPIITRLDGNYSMPWLIGILGLLCLAVTACLTTQLLRIRQPLGCIICAGLITAFPTVASTYSYMFTADAYLFGLMLAAFSAYAVSHFPYTGLFVGLGALIFSLGIYQSYFSVAAVLMVGALFFDAIDGEKSLVQVLVKGVKMLVVLGGAMAVYMLMVRLTTAQTGLTSYMGISDMGHIELADLPELVEKCYTKYAEFFVDNDNGLLFEWLPTLLIVALACSVAFLLVLLWQRRVGVIRSVLAILLIVLYPLAGNLIHIMVGGAQVHMLMIYAMVYALILPLGMVGASYEEGARAGAISQTMQGALSWVIIAALALSAYSFIVTDNKAYMRMALGYEQCYAYANRLLSAIEGVPGYYTGMPVILVGNSTHEPSLDVTPELEDTIVDGAIDFGALRQGYTFDAFLKDYLGFASTVYTDDRGVAKEMGQRPEVQAMATYPYEGSIQIIDGYVVVRLN